MQITATPAPKSTVVLEIELPAERLDRAVGEAVRHLSQRTRVPGFRPGKAPRPVLERHLGPGAVLDDAVDHLVQSAYREALVEQDLLPLTNADVEVVQAEEGKPLVFKATVQVRPEVKLGDYQHFNFSPEIDTIDDARIDQVIEELRDQNATLVGGRGSRREGGRLRGRLVRRHARRRAVRGRQLRADADHPRPGAVDPRVRGPPERARGRRQDRVRHHVPGRLPGERSLPASPPTSPSSCGSLREKVQPDLDDDFIRTLGDFADVDALRADIKTRLERNALDRARHGFADRIIEYAVANATLDLPDVLVDQEVEVMHDEFRSTLARQGIGEEAYLKAVEKTEADLHGEFRPGAEKRVRTLLVLSEVADAQGVTAPEAEVEAEIARGRERYANDPRLLSYFDSDRGRSYIRSTLRRSRVVEGLIDEWLAAHPDHQPLPHLEDAPESSIEGGEVAANASIAAG